MDSHSDASISFGLSDPYADDEDAALPAPMEDARVAQRLTALWAMLARPPMGPDTTLYGHLSQGSTELAGALERARSPLSALAGCLAQLLGEAALGQEDLPASARVACLEAVERMVISHAGLPSATRAPPPERPRVVIAARAVDAAESLLPSLRAAGFRAIAHEARSALALLEEHCCEAVVFRDDLGVRAASSFCLDLRDLPLHTRTPVLCLTGHPDYPLEARHTPCRGMHVASQRAGALELAVRLHTLLV